MPSWTDKDFADYLARGGQVVNQDAVQYEPPVDPEATEHTDQVRLFRWMATVPALALAFAIPNGAKLPWAKDAKGNRYSAEAKRLKDEGLKRGVPDIFIPVQRGGYGGMFLELKRADLSNHPSTAQLDYMAGLREAGYWCIVAYGIQEAMGYIQAYLDMGTHHEPN